MIAQSFVVGDAQVSPSESTGSPVLHGLRKIERLVDQLTATWVNSQSLFSRRFHRVTFRRPIAIAPLCDETLHPAGSPTRAAACDISHGGMSFEHTRPLSCRFVAVSIPTAAGEFESLIVRLNWCRFTQSGMYRSGGKINRLQRFGWERGLDLSRLAEG